MTQKIKQKRIREVSDEAQIRSVSQPDKKRKPLLGCSNEWAAKWQEYPSNFTATIQNHHANGRVFLFLPDFCTAKISSPPLCIQFQRESERERERCEYIYIHVCVKGCWLCIEVIIGYAKQPKRGGNRPLIPSVSLWEHSLVLSNQSYHSTEETLPNKESWKRLLW